MAEQRITLNDGNQIPLIGLGTYRVSKTMMITLYFWFSIDIKIRLFQLEN